MSRTEGWPVGPAASSIGSDYEGYWSPSVIVMVIMVFGSFLIMIIIMSHLLIIIMIITSVLNNRGCENIFAPPSPPYAFVHGGLNGSRGGYCSNE